MLFASRRPSELTPQELQMPIRFVFPLPFCPCFFFPHPPIHLLEHSVFSFFPYTSHAFISPGSRHRFQQCWYYDGVWALHWSPGLHQVCCVPRPAATSTVPGRPPRLRTAGRTRITSRWKFHLLRHRDVLTFSMITRLNSLIHTTTQTSVFVCWMCHRERPHLCSKETSFRFCITCLLPTLPGTLRAQWRNILRQCCSVRSARRACGLS